MTVPRDVPPPPVDDDAHETATFEPVAPPSLDGAGPAGEPFIGVPAVVPPLPGGGNRGGGRPGGDVSGKGKSSGGGGGDDVGAAGDGTPGVPGGVNGARLPAPLYPRESRLRGEQGTVILEVDLSVDGMPTAVRVVDDAGYPRLAKAAVEAIKAARLAPAHVGGRPVPSSARIPFRFSLRDRAR
jgi:protein TonB